MNLDEVEANERGQFSAILTEQTWSMKELLYGQKENFFKRNLSSPLG